MPQTLPEFLIKRAERGLSYILRETDAVRAEDAFRGRRADWPRQPWGIGQDGSIAGIVYHVAAWKQRTLPLLTANGKSTSRTDIEPAAAPDPTDWPALCHWLREVGTAWNRALAVLPDAEFDAPREWDGTIVTVTQIVTEMILHDVQHAAQLEYLRQLYGFML